MLYYHISTNYSWNVFTVECPFSCSNPYSKKQQKTLTLYAKTFEIVHSGI